MLWAAKNPPGVRTLAAPLDWDPRSEVVVAEPEAPEPEAELEELPLGEVALAEEPDAVVVAFAAPDLGVPGFFTSKSEEEAKI